MERRSSMKMQKIERPTMKIAGDPASNSRQSSLKLALKPNGPFRYGSRLVFPLKPELVMSVTVIKNDFLTTLRKPLLVFGKPKFGMTSGTRQTGIA